MNTYLLKKSSFFIALSHFARTIPRCSYRDSRAVLSTQGSAFSAKTVQVPFWFWRSRSIEESEIIEKKQRHAGGTSSGPWLGSSLSGYHWLLASLGCSLPAWLGQSPHLPSFQQVYPDLFTRSESKGSNLIVTLFNSVSYTHYYPRERHKSHYWA